MEIYRQTTKFTCGPACALMVLHHYYPQRFSLTQEKELRFWQKSVRSPLKGTSQYAIASLLHNEGLKVHIYVGRIKFSSLFWKQYKKLGFTRKDAKLGAIIEDFYYKDALQEGVTVNKKNLKFTDIKKFIKESDFVLLRVNMKILRPRLKNLTHYVVISEQKDDQFHVFDPYNGEYWIDEKRLAKAFLTVKSKCGEDYRAITVEK